MIKESIELLGRKGTDKITGFHGVISSVGFDLYGCVVCILTPPTDKDEKIRDGHWFDVQRIEVSDERVMPVPDFDKDNTKPKTYSKGAAEKPLLDRRY